MIQRIEGQWAALVVDRSGNEHDFAAENLLGLLGQIRARFPAPSTYTADPLYAIASNPVDATEAARLLGVTYDTAHRRLARAVALGWMVKVRRGMYEVAR
jgi:hypothetical protein